MFWLHHPQPVRPRKAVAEQMVATKMVAPMSTTVIIIDRQPMQTVNVFDGASEDLSEATSFIQKPHG